MENSDEVMMETTPAPRTASNHLTDSDNSEKENVLESKHFESSAPAISTNKFLEDSTLVNDTDVAKQNHLKMNAEFNEPERINSPVKPLPMEEDDVPSVLSTDLPVSSANISPEKSPSELNDAANADIEKASCELSEAENPEKATCELNEVENPEKAPCKLSEAAKKFAEQEAELNSYLEQNDEEDEKVRKEKEEEKARANKPASSESDPIVKPKRMSIKERLQNLPGNLLNKKPMIRPTSKQIIDLGEDVKGINITKRKGIEDLMARYDIHTAVNKPSKEEHYKIHITKKEEDSQGITHLHTDETEYIKVIPDEEIEEMTSPQVQAPGVKMGQVKAKLMSEIRANRAKAYEEKMKEYAMYSEEKELDGKGEEDEEEEELLLDDDTTDEDDNDDEEGAEGEDPSDRSSRKKKKKKKKKSKLEDDEDGEEGENNSDSDDATDFDEEAEEDFETLLDGNPREKKKAKKRLVYLEEEAEESDEAGALSNDDDEDRLDRVNKGDVDFIDDRPIESSDEDSGDEGADNKKLEGSDDRDRDAPLDNSEGFLFDTQTESQIPPGQPPSEKTTESQDLFSDFENEIASQRQLGVSTTPSKIRPLPSFLDPNKTPVISASILSNNRGPSPLGPWNSISSMMDPPSIIRNPGSHISPLPRINSDAALEAFCQDHPHNTSTVFRKHSPAIPTEVAKLVGTQPPLPSSQSNIDDDLEAICSARFPSQSLPTQPESQEFDCFGFEEDFETDTSQNAKESLTPQPSTPMSSSILSLAATETPKTTTSDRAPRNTRLNFNNVSVVSSANTPSGVTDQDDEKKSGNDSGDDGNIGNLETDDDDDEKDVVIGAKKLVKRKRKRLQFSDDEDSDGKEESDHEGMDVSEDKVPSEESEAEEDSEDAASKNSGGEEEGSDLEVEYDENEEEILKPKFKGLMSRKTGMLRQEFVEGEAELSGSEEGSADEDEKDMEEYEDEVADQEEIDIDHVKDQNARVFHKLELDQDQRDIRDFENRFLENGDLDTEGNERTQKFKWKNMDESKLDCYKDDDVDQDVEEDEVEKQRRKEYKEKLKAMNVDGSSDGVDLEKVMSAFEEEASQKILGDSQFLKLSKKVTSRKSAKTKNMNRSISLVETTSISITNISNSKPTNVTSGNPNPNPHSIIPETSPRNTFQRKGSFLLRETTITRQAEMFRINETMNLKKGKSFVFAVVTPPSEAESKKNSKGNDNNSQSNGKRNSARSQPKKIIKIDAASAGGGGQNGAGSIFKWI